MSIFAAFPILFLLFPLTLVAVCFAFIENRRGVKSSSETGTEAEKATARNQSLRKWFIADAILIGIWLPLVFLPETEFGHKLFHISHGEELSAIICFAGVPIIMAVPFAGMWYQRMKNKRWGTFRVFLFLLSAALGVPSLYVFMFLWPIGYLVVAPITLFGIIYLIRSAKNSHSR